MTITIIEMLMLHNAIGIVALFLVMIPVLKGTKRWKMWFTIYAAAQLLIELNDLLRTSALF